MNKLFLNSAVPEKIFFVENYFYQVEESSNSSTTIQQSPSGTIQIITPYDGKLNFPPEEIKFLEDQDPDI